MNGHEIYNYNDYRQYLRDWLAASKARNPRLSLRYWSTKMGFSSPSHLHMILSGTRSFPMRRLPQVTDALGLDTTSAQFFENLIWYCDASDEAEKQLRYEKLRSTSSVSSFRILTNEQFHLISDTLHLTLLELASTRIDLNDAAAIKRALRVDRSLADINAARDRLEQLGLLKNENGVWKKTEEPLTSADVPSRAIQAFHRHMIQMAAQSIDEQEVLRRDISGYTLAFNEEDMAAAKKMIEEFRWAFAKRFQRKTSAKSVFQLNVQFFELTKSQPQTKLRKTNPLPTLNEKRQKRREL